MKQFWQVITLQRPHAVSMLPINNGWTWMCSYQVGSWDLACVTGVKQKGSTFVITGVVS